MGLIHSRAAKKRNRALARLAREQAQAVRQQRRQAQREDGAAALAAASGVSWWRQPTLGAAISAWQGRQDAG
jgi:hypothetical protein